MDAPANCAFSGPITSIFNSIHFDGDPFTCQCEKEDKKAYGSCLRVSNFALSWVVFKWHHGSEGVNVHLHVYTWWQPECSAVECYNSSERERRECRLPERLGNKNCQHGHTHAILSPHEIHLRMNVQLHIPSDPQHVQLGKATTTTTVRWGFEPSQPHRVIWGLVNTRLVS